MKSFSFFSSLFRWEKEIFLSNDRNIKMKILIAEDETQIAESLRKNFIDEGHRAVIAADGAEALRILDSIVFDVVLLDWKMPGLTGLEVCRKIRADKNEVPVILITALGDVFNKVEALNSGADDYITKPFSFDEVYARVNAVIRRASHPRDVLEFDDLTLDLNKRKVMTDTKEEIHLTDKEFDLLKYMIDNKGAIISKENLCRYVWDLNFTPQTNICEATVKNLRKKLEEITGRKYIKNIYGEGYILIAD
jgi:DNA-binding response OmpR family regulator